MVQFGEDLPWCLGPGEGLGVGVVLGDVAVDRGLQVHHGAEAAALEPAPGGRASAALRSSPSTPASAKRRCQRHTAGRPIAGRTPAQPARAKTLVPSVSERWPRARLHSSRARSPTRAHRRCTSSSLDSLIVQPSARSHRAPAPAITRPDSPHDRGTSGEQVSRSAFIREGLS
jgi:hypothetical protein